MTSKAQARWLDGVGIGISSVCMIHCLFLPLIIVLSPAWSSWLDIPEDIHPWLLALALPFSGTVLWRAASAFPRAKLSLALGLTGLAMMSAALFIEREKVEIAMTSIGALLVASAHLRNWRSREHRHA